MALAEIQNVEKAYAGRSVLRGISFDLQPGQRIGLVGPNGGGKTTLLKLLAGVEEPDHGSVTVARSVRMSYVPQVPALDPDETLRHQVSLVFEELRAVERRLHEAAEVLATTHGAEHDRAMARYAQLEAQHQHMGGYNVEHRVESVLDQLGFAQRDLDLPIKALSGGQKSRAQIARLLLEAPDLMLLDEPTNHLDLAMLDWLEATLNEMSDSTLVVVSHDRYFLDSVVDEIFDLQAGKIERYPGNYSAFVELKAERQLAQQRAFDQQQAYIAKQQEFIRRFQANQRARQARGRRTRLERLKRDNLVGGAAGPQKKAILNLEVDRPSGLDVLKVDGLTKMFPEKSLFVDIHLHVLRGKRLGVIGPNGSGKTTLLNILAGEAPPDVGSIKWGHNVDVQFYRQEHQDLTAHYRVIDELQQTRITATQQELRDLAGLLLFSGDTIEKKIEVLSGGEKARVAIAKLLLKPANTILMDEPTNHLDMQTAEVLEEALDTYDGTLILVSHDRYFIDQVCDQLLVLGGDGTWRIFEGSYTDYLAALAREREVAAAAKREAEKLERQRNIEREAAARAREKARRAQRDAANPKLLPKYQRLTLEQIESQIMALESQIAEVEARFGDGSLAANPAAMQELHARYEEQKSELADLNAAWEARIE